MLEKKLLTLASAAAILACGACFLPPLPSHQPPPPRVRTVLEDLRSIRVTVKNNSATHHLDPAELAAQAASAINWQTGHHGAHAFVDNAGANADAVLEIVVEKETVEQDVPGRAPRTRWITYLIEDSATLTRPDGELLWSETGFGNRIFLDFANENSDDPWSRPDREKSLNRPLVARLVYRMISMR
jgi:hypothetical protein